MKYDPAEIAFLLNQANRYTDSQRLAHTETTQTVILPKTIVSYVEEFEGYLLPIEGEIVVGKEYLVVVDGETYMVTGSEAQDDDGSSGIVLDCTDGEWMIIYFSGQFCGFAWQESKTGTTTDTTISITTETETIHPIPAEYIPPLDRLILNGADGNQYALTITDGALSVAPVETT